MKSREHFLGIMCLQKSIFKTWGCDFIGTKQNFIEKSEVPFDFLEALF